MHLVPSLAINTEHDLVVMTDCMVKPIYKVGIDHPHIDFERGNHVDTKLRVKFLNNVAVFLVSLSAKLGAVIKDVYNYYYNFILR